MLEGNTTARFLTVLATTVVAQQAPNKDMRYTRMVGGKELLAINRQTGLGN